MFDDAVRKFSSQMSVRMGDKSFSYQELQTLSNKIAHDLISRGVKPGEVVGISMTRSLEMVASIIAILKTGASYLPLDPEYPLERLQFMISHSHVEHLLLDKKSASLLKIDDSREIIFERMNLNNSPSENPKISYSPESLCYVIYTSGSSGKPKGVALGHKALSNLIVWQNEQSLVKQQCSTLQFTPISFDVHFQEIFSTLTSGGTLILIPEETRLDPGELLKIIESCHINRIFLPYVALNHLAEMAIHKGIFPQSLKEVTTAGEQLKITPSIRTFFKNLDRCALFNHYGPSETHVVTSHALTGDASSWPGLPPIGHEISNCKVLLLDKDLCEVSVGSEGEIYIGGVCLADGYLHSLELTNERFIQTSQYGRIYKTGDSGTIDENQIITFLGRKDGQVKVRGYRVELGEIELLIMKQTGIDQCIVDLRTDRHENYLCAYICGNANLNILREDLRNVLPQYMVPSYFIKIDSLPLTPSGKVDKTRLPSPSGQRPDLSNAYTGPQNELESNLVASWTKFLNIENPGVEDSFFDLGGNSLLALKVVIDINQWSHQKINILQFFQKMTIKKLAQFIEGKDKASGRKIKKKSSGSSIAIIGMTGRFPGASNVEELWENLIEGKNSVEKFSEYEANSSFRDDPSFVPVEGKFPGDHFFDFKYFGMTPREAELMDPQQRKLLELSVEALELSGHLSEAYDGTIGIFAGMGNSHYGNLVHSHPDKVEALGDFNVMLGLEKDYLATRVAYKLNLTGPAISIHTGCSTSLVAIIEAVKSLRQGDCDMALAGGISISGSSKRGHLYQEGGILSKDGICKPFDESATGTIFTDGAGVLVLKRLEDAEVERDNIIAVIKGVGLNNDGSEKMSFTAPSISGQVDVILRAQIDAGIEASSLGYVEAHGTATPVGDPIEVEALSKAFNKSSNKKNYCYLSSIKSNLGHLTAAAGVAGVIKTALSLKHKKIPGTANFEKPNKLLNLDGSPFIVTREPSEFPLLAEKRMAGVSSFGVGGTNAHLILEEYVEKCETENSWKRPLLFKLSAKTENQLEVMMDDLKGKINHSSRDIWAKMSYTLEVGRQTHPYRKYIVVQEKEDINKPGGSKHDQGMQSLFFAFPGQGSQYSGMGQALSEKSPIFKAYFDECCNLHEKISGYKIKDVIFDVSKKNDLNNTYYTQPAIFIIEYALAMTYIELGIKPKALIGHSIGEYVAAVIAGIFSLEDGLKIITKRAELIQEIETGVMLSVAISHEKALSLISGHEVDLAAVNAPLSCVIAGSFGAMEDFKQSLLRNEIAFIELKTSHAFHSRMMFPAISKFKSFLKNFIMSSPKIPIFSTVTSGYEIELLVTPDYWAEHLTNCVHFSPSIKKIMEKEKALFLEIGPGNVLTNLIKKQSANAVQSLSYNKDLEEFSITKSLGELWLNGFNLVDPSVLYQQHERKKTPTTTYSFEKNICWLESKNNSGDIMMNTNKEDLTSRLIGIFEKSSGIDVKSYGVHAHFLEMGMDSLFLTQVALKLKKELKVNVTFRQLLEELSTIDLLANAFAEKVVDTPVIAPEIKVTKDELIQSHPGVESIVNRQLDLMAQQIQLLKGIPATEVRASVKEEVTPESVERSKEAFGAAARITREKSSHLTPIQSKRLNDFFTDYCQKTRLSKNFTQNHRKVHADPRVVTGFKPENKEIVYPIVVNKSSAQKLWDIDGNEYIDMICGFGSNFFGNGNERIKSYVMKQMNEGIEVGPQHPLVGEVSDLICELTGNERTAFCNTGSEAVLGAMRIARTVTGREKIIVFSGSYHGINDEVILRAAKGTSYPASPGINDAAVENMIVMDYGTDESLDKIRKISHEVAAILIEPVQSRRCDFRPVEFLKEVRKISQETETCLIFDEVITGFRIHPGGAQAHFGIKADLCTYGKIVGGGMPIGVISGKSKFMDALDGGHWQFGDDSIPTAGVTYFAGTFVRHPLALAAAKGALEIIKEGGVNMLNDVTARADKFAKEINLLCSQHNLPLELNNFGSLMKPKWKKEIPSGEILFPLLRFNGVHVYDGFPWFVNLAHTEADLEFVLKAFKKSIMSMQLMGLVQESKMDSTQKIFDAAKAPVPGARIGRDEAGNPAWFVENPAKAGDYFLVEG
jgi:amino acid adenylation domain-containing protein